MRDDSRSKMKLFGNKLTIEQTLYAAIADRIGILIWQNTENGQKGINFPVSIIEEINRDHSKDIRGFSSGDELLAELKKYEA